MCYADKCVSTTVTRGKGCGGTGYLQFGREGAVASGCRGGGRGNETPQVCWVSVTGYGGVGVQGWRKLHILRVPL